MIDEKSDKPIDERPDDVSDPSLDDNLAELTDAEESAAKAVQEQEGEKEDPDAIPKQEYEEDPREELEEAIMAGKQDEEVAEGEKAGDKPAEGDAENPPAEAAKPAAAEDDDDPLVKVKVEGEEREVRQSQLVRNFQKEGAAEKRLQEATELLRQAEKATTAAPIAPTEPTTSNETSDDSSTGDDPKLDETLAGIAEKIQVGDTKEAVEALKTVIAEARKGVAQPAPEGINQEQVQTAVLEAQERERSKTSLETFNSDNPELAGDKRLRNLMKNELQDVMVEQLKSSLKSEGYSDEDMATIDTLSQEQVTQAHRAGRGNGRIKASTETVLTTARDRLAEANLWPAKVPETTDRTERKKNALQQPGPKSKAPATEQQRKPSVQSTGDIVAEEQAARGNPAI